MSVKLKIGNRKLAARIEGGTNLHRLARHELPDFAQGSRYAAQYSVGHRWRVFHVQPMPPMRSLPVRIIGWRWTRWISVAQVLGPVKLIVHAPAIVQNLAAISRPKHYG